MRFQSYFNTAIKIIQLYDGALPLHHYLKQYFAQHKKHGSKDRKFIAQLCYNLYRLGKSFTEISIEEKLKLAIFICNDYINEWQILFDEEWKINHAETLQQRIAFIKKKYAFSLADVFPFTDELSDGVNTDAFIESFFIQPDVFIRTRNGYDEQIIHKLHQHNISFKSVDESCIVLPASTNISSIIKIDEEAVIQDYSSQRIKEFLHTIKLNIDDLTSPINIWIAAQAAAANQFWLMMF